MRFVHSLIIIAFIFALCSVTAIGMTLEKDAIYSYKLETVSENPKILRISGLSGHSALSVEHIYTKTEDKTITVYIRLIFAPKDPKFSGSFNYLLEVPDNIDSVELGEKKAVIWERQQKSNTK